MQKHLTFSLALLTLLCTSAHAQLPSYLPADGLVGWWPFNGNANDESGNGNDGVVNGATLAEDRFGNANFAYSFNGVSNCIDVLHSTSLSIFGSQSASTISLWCYTELNEPADLINKGFHSGVASFGNKYLSLTNDAVGYQYTLYDFSTLNSVRPPDGYLNTQQWYHMLIVRDANIKVYVNGIDVTTSANDAGWSTNYNLVLDNTNMSFGCRNNKDNNNVPPYQNLFYTGKIDDIAIYNRALTPQEIQNLYNAPNETVDTGDGATPLPQGIPYQAAARDAQGQAIVSAPVNVRFSLHEGAVDGAVSYSETHALTTNGIGLFNTVFGDGTPEQSAFDSINWAATTKFLQVEIDLGDGYVDMGTTQLLSVPYAFRSDEAARIKNAGLPIFADNTAALAGGLVAGEMYRTATGDLKVVY